MSDGRTEAPTPRRLREARRRGDVARSAELTAAAALAGGLAGLTLLGPGLAGALARALAGALTAGAAPDPGAALRETAALVLRLAVPPACGAFAAAALAGALQSGFLFSLEAARPRLDRVDPLRGVARLVDAGQVGRALLSLVKAAAAGALLAGWWPGAARTLGALPRAPAPAALAVALPLVTGLALRVAAVLALLGAADLLLARRRLREGLRMTRDEVRRELREDEGDPAHRGERRRLHRALLDGGPVARATVVVVNPTRLAVALRHERGSDEAPRVLAKGSGLAASRIRSAARRAGVPIVRDVPLARALHRLADVGDEIPEELYDAAAAILVHLHAAPEVR